MNNLPKHVAIIMDGNGRWAKSQNKNRTFGHYEGMSRVIDIVQHSSDLGIKYLTLYAFSTENWKRPGIEVRYLMHLIPLFINKEIDKLNRNKVKIIISGDYSKMSKNAVESIDNALNITKNNEGLVLNLALNYGAKEEVLMAVKKIIEDGIKKEDLDYNAISQRLYTSGIPDPEIVIRTSGEKRLSNFLLLQSAYAEFIFTDVLWPDFGKEEFDKCLSEYFKRNRRFGGL